MTVFRKVSVPFAVALGCSSPAGVAAPEGVTVNVTDSAVVITNGRSAEIVYMILDANFAARANWAPCVQEDCSRIFPGESRRIGAGEIGGWGESNTLIAYWWHVYESPDGGFYRDSIRAVRARY